MNINTAFTILSQKVNKRSIFLSFISQPVSKTVKKWVKSAIGINRLDSYRIVVSTVVPVRYQNISNVTYKARGYSDFDFHR